MTFDFNSPATCSAGELGPSLTDVCSASSVFLFVSLLNALIRDNEKISGKCQRVKPIETTDREYDFIVVGGGAAGSVIASRLSENPRWKILLLEAGPDEPAGAQVPGLASAFLNTDITWNYVTTNESHACLATNGTCGMTQGKNLGGNTVHNGMIYLRGHPLDYQHWAELGNEGWSWDEIEQYFFKNEDNGEIERVGRVHHATGGPLPVERYPYFTAFGNSILEASSQAGYGVSEDLNGDMKSGFSQIQAMQEKGVRRSSARAYLWPARNRRNLHISLNSTVTKVIIENKTAVGVVYFKNGVPKSVRATREVIISGGVVQSPHLLLLSGIGPEDQLESVGVPVIHHLPGVGENLHDHPCAIIPLTMNEPDTFDNNWVTAFTYLVNQTGHLSSIGSMSAIGMLESKVATPNRPDIEVYIYSYLSNCATGEVGGLQSAGRRAVTLLPSFLYPKSRGRISLVSNDPFENPSIWMNYLAASEDIDGMVEAIKKALALLDTEAFRAYNVTLSDEPVEACSNHEFKSDEYWACIARQANYALYHQGGTCKMGPPNDPMAVVDSRLRVRGIKRLRVVDNSIMPDVPASNTAAPAMMIGERGADLIKEDWARQPSSWPRPHGRSKSHLHGPGRE